MERPLFLGLLWWLFSGDFTPALPLAVFFELLWIDLFPIGGYIPPMPAVPYLIILSLAGIFGWQDAQTIAFPLIISLPLAYIAPWAETRQRNKQKNAYSTLLTHARKRDLVLERIPGLLLARSSMQLITGGLLLFITSWAFLYFLFAQPGIQKIFLFPLAVNWSVLYAIAAIGALLALRIKRSYVIFTLSMSGALLLRLF